MPEKPPGPHSHQVASHPLDLTRLIYMFYMDVEQQIGRADAKAQIVLSANAILLAINAGLGTRAFLESRPPLIEILATLVVVAFSLASVYFAIGTTIPRSGGDSGGHPAGYRSLFYTGHITQLDADDYVNRFNQATLGDVLDNVMREVYNKAQVLHRKMLFVRRSMIFLMLAYGAWAASEILHFFV